MIELREYCTSSASSASESESRFSNLLLRLAPLRSLQPDVLEELFFAGLIGNVQIDSVVPYILKMETSEYQAQFGDSNATEEAKENERENGNGEKDEEIMHFVMALLSLKPFP